MLSDKTWKCFWFLLQLFGAILLAWELLAIASCIGQHIHAAEADNYAAYDNQAACYICLTGHGPIYRFLLFLRANTESISIAVSALATIFIAGFTYTLKRSTDNLWGQTTVVERAYVYPVIVGHGAIGDCIEVARASNEDDVPQPMTAELMFKFKNFGKTPAILKTAFAGVGVAPLGARIGLPLVESVLGVGEETVTPLISEMQVGITRRQAQHILAYTRHICFEGHVTFDDIWGNEHTTEFYFVWDHWISRMNLRWTETKTKRKGEQSENNT